MSFWMFRCLRRRRDWRRLLYITCIFVIICWLELTLINWSNTDAIPLANKLPNVHGGGDDQSLAKISSESRNLRETRQRTNDSYRPVQALVVHSSTATRRCTAKTNFVYIKEIKCASQTLVNVFRRFGLERNLSFVTPIGKKIYLGWPWLIEPRYYRPSKAKGFNILCEHAIFDERLMKALMPDDVVFITSLRQPFSQFKSMFNYYDFKRILNISASNPISEYLHHLEHYEPIYVSKNASKFRYCVPDGFHMSKNLMAYNLGFPTGYLPGRPDMSSNHTYIDHYLSYLDRTFYFVIIVEYFHESLVLLKRLMCWNLTDIVYLKKNVASYPFKSNNDPELVEIYRKWSSVDFRLYDHFNRTFWQRVRETTPDFRQEVRHFDRIIHDVSDFCSGLAAGRMANESFIAFHKSRWNEPFRVNKRFCEILNAELLPRIQKEWEEARPELRQPTPDRNFC